MLRLFKGLYVWLAFIWGVICTLALVVNFYTGDNAGGPQTHRFDQQMCQYSVEIDNGKWQRSNSLLDTYVPTQFKLIGEADGAYLHFTSARRSTRVGPLATLFRADGCVAQELGEDRTSDGLVIRLQAVECNQQSPSSLSPQGRFRLYGTIHGHWIALGAGLFANNKEQLTQYRTQLVQILRSFKHQCAFEFSPLPTGEQAEKAAIAAAEEATDKAAAAAGAAEAAAKGKQ